MKKFIVFVIGFGMLIFSILCSPKSEEKNINAVTQTYSDYTDSLGIAIQTFVEIVNNKSASFTDLKNGFSKMRSAYKMIELFVDYYNPGTAKAFNGPALYEVEAENPSKPNAPSGFQVLEEAIFKDTLVPNYKAIKQQAAILASLSIRIQAAVTNTQITDAHFFDALRLSIVRLETLGISGYDSPIYNNSINEASYTIEALEAYLKAYTKHIPQDLLQEINNTKEYIKQSKNFNVFNRAVFIVDQLNPLSKALYKSQMALQIPFFEEQRPLRASAVTIFDTTAFNAWFYSPKQRNTNNTVISKLGERLFFEKKLSSNAIRNCASCHIPEKAFTDGLVKNKSFDGKSIIARNTPTLYYSALQPVQFADSRLVYLEDQAKQVIENPNELHGNLSMAAKQLERDQGYQQLFELSFGSKDITAEKIQVAIAAYIRTKNPFNSSFDEYMRGNKAALSPEAINGFNLFMGKAKCGTCHFAPLFNGVVPPHFLTMESEVLGTPKSNTAPYQVDSDSGKYKLYQAALHLYAFKTPTVRNIALTAPYMHNGVYKSLDEVIDFYNQGGAGGMGIKLTNQTLPTDPLYLTKAEKKAIIAFLNSLTDSTALNNYR